MLDGPYTAKTWRERFQRVESGLAIAYVFFGTIALAIFGYQLAVAGDYLKLGVLVLGGGLLLFLLLAGLRPLWLMLLAAIFGVILALRF